MRVNNTSEIYQFINETHDLIEKQKLSEAEKKIEELESLNSSRKNDTLTLNILFLKAKYSLKKILIAQALNYLFKSLELSKKLGHIQFSADILNHIGVCYSALKLFKKAISFYRESLELKKNPIVMINLADRLADINKTDEAISLYNEVLQIIPDESKSEYNAIIYSSLGDVYLKEKKWDLALKYYQDGLFYCIETDNLRNQNFIYIGLGRYYIQQNNLKLSYEYLEKALEIAEKLHNQELLWFTYDGLIEYYETIGDYKNLYFYYKNQSELKDKIFNSGIEQKIAGLEAAYSLENKKLEAEKMIEKSSKLVSIGVMAAGITHEINQPLNTIAVNADGILFTNEHDKILTPFYIDAVQQIYEAAIRISDIIKHMRQFWAPDDYLEKKVFDVNQSIINALNLINKKIEIHEITIRKKLCSASISIKGNSVHLEQIIINLITNSIQALDESKKEDKIIEIQTFIDLDMLKLIIKDNGMGFDENMLHEIFSPFYSTKSSESNMGLGLAIVNQFVKSMNGKITCFNNHLGGATFEISLPLAIGDTDENIIN